ncbi:MAG: hypothetical protein ABIP20_06180 [Chthoniobacteraceae bacterium]
MELMQTAAQMLVPDAPQNPQRTRHALKKDFRPTYRRIKEDHIVPPLPSSPTENRLGNRPIAQVPFLQHSEGSRSAIPLCRTMFSASRFARQLSRAILFLWETSLNENEVLLGVALEVLPAECFFILTLANRAPVASRKAAEPKFLLRFRLRERASSLFVHPSDADRPEQVMRIPLTKLRRFFIRRDRDRRLVTRKNFAGGAAVKTTAEPDGLKIVADRDVLVRGFGSLCCCGAVAHGRSGHE